MNNIGKPVSNTNSSKLSLRLFRKTLPFFLLALSLMKLWGVNAQSGGVPVEPTDLLADAGWQKVTLSWTPSASAGVIDYRVLRSSTSGGTFASVANNVVGTTFTDTGLTNGTQYFYIVKARNSEGESIASNEVSATPVADTTNPDTSSVAAPANNGALKTLASLSGTAVDNTGGSGIARVDVYLRHIITTGVYEYWANRSGTWGWGSDAQPVPAYVNGNNWSVSATSPAGTVLPSDTNLPDGTYLINAWAYDRANNSENSTVNQFTVDAVAPATVAVSAPANGGTVKSLTTLSGTAVDNTGGSGIARVDVYLRHIITTGVYEYWANRSGTWGWGSDAQPVSTTFSGSSWSVTTNSPNGTVLPVDSNLPDGTYLINAWAYDRANNSKNSTVNQFTVDAVAPATVAVSAPANNGAVKALAVLSGTVVDNTGGSGISRVDVYLRHIISTGVYEYWGNRSGTWGWGSDAVPLPAYVNGNNWSVSASSPAGTVLPSGSSLPDGTYLINAWAYDRANNSKNSDVNQFYVDTTNPDSVVVSTPAAGVGVKTISVLSGTAADSSGGSGIATVNAYIRRIISSGVFEYWGNRSGTWGWASDVKHLPAYVNGNNWSVSATSPAGTVFPSGSNLPDGAYIVHAYAYDKAGNYKNSANNLFYVDTTVPDSVSVLIPAADSSVKTISTLSGTAIDNTGGAGIATVNAYLRRVISSGVYEYWGNRSGTWGWASDAIPLPASVTGNSWSVSAAAPAGTVLPSGSNLPDGTYIVHAYAYDKANNYKNSANNLLTVDNLSPSVTLDNPVSGSGLRTLTTINGSSSDNAGGSGIARIDVYLYHFNGGVTEYWGKRNGVWGWGATSVPNPATVYSTSWTLNNDLPAGSVLPSGSDLPDGTYFARAWAYDKAGNSQASVTSSFLATSDEVPPTVVSVTAPGQGTGLRNITTINGVHADNAGGSGIGRVDAYLYRFNGGVAEYWAKRSGVWGWATTAVAMPATVYSTSWSITATSPSGTVFPSGADLPDGTYFAKAWAYDKAGNSKSSTTNVFTAFADDIAPASATVVAPAYGISVQAIPNFSGTAVDNTGGSGIGRVDSYLRREIGTNVYEYWANRSGTWGWSSAPTPIAATVSGNNWSVSESSPAGTVFPSGANLVDGSYIVHAWVYDKAGNVKSSSGNTFTVDRTLPSSVVVTAPANGATIAGLVSINGTAADNTGGSGVGSVQAYFRRVVSPGNYQYWGNRSGTWGWGSNDVAMPAVQSGTNWSVSNDSLAGTVLPSIADLTNGSYEVYAWVYDKANNGLISSINAITVLTAPAPTQLYGVPSAGQVVLNWTASAGSTSYKVKRAAVSGGPYTTIAPSVTTTTYTDAPVPSSDIYYYIVTATIDGNESAPSNEVAIAPIVDNVVPAVTIATPVHYSRQNSITSISGTTNDNFGGSGISRVSLQLRNTINGVPKYWNGTAWVTTNVFFVTDATLTPNGAGYNFNCNSNLPSASDIPVGWTILTAVAYDRAGKTGTHAVTLLKGNDVTKPVVTLTDPAAGSALTSLTSIAGNMNDPAGASGEDVTGMYLVQASLQRTIGGVTTYWNTTTQAWQAGAIGISIYSSSPSATSWNWIGALPSGANLISGNYSVGITAYDYNLNSLSLTSGFTVVPPAAPTILYGIPSAGSVALSWDASAGATGYNVKRATSAGGPYATIATNVSTTSYTDASAPTSDTYYYVVTALYGVNESALSNEVGVAPIVDTIVPTVQITSPVHSSRSNVTTSISGTASDNAGGSGIAKVALQLRNTRYGVATYWNGTAWVSNNAFFAPTTTLTPNGTGYNFTCNVNLPSAADTPLGWRILTAVAYDRAGKTGTHAVTLLKGTDVTKPLVTITTPANGSTMESLPSIGGTVSDPAGAVGEDVTGLYAVNSTLKRTISGATSYWNPTTSVWQPSAVNSVHYILSTSSTTWGWSGSVPSGANLMPGSYTVSAIAYDNTLNASNTATSNFTIAPNRPPVAAPQTIMLLKNTSASITLSGTDSDGNALTYSVVTQPDHGTLTGTAPALTYTPANNYTGEDSFRFKVNDGIVDSVLVPVTIVVIPPDAPQPPSSQLLDSQIRNSGDVGYTGTGIYSADGQNQSVSQKIMRGQTAEYNVKVSLGQFGTGALRLAGTGSGDGWTVRYYLNTLDGGGQPHEEEITSAITGSGASFDTSHDYDITIRVSADETVEVAESKTVKLDAAALPYIHDELSHLTHVEPVQRDVVAAVTSCDQDVDALIRNQGVSSFLGQNIFNTTGEFQTARQSKSADATATYEMRVLHPGGASDTLHLKAPIASPGWTVRYYDVDDDDADVTAAITSNVGWTTRVLQNGDPFDLLITVTPDETVGTGDIEDTPIEVALSGQPEKDVVRAATTKTGAARQPKADLLIRNVNESDADYIGNAIYNSTASGQTKVQTAVAATASLYLVKVQNDKPIAAAFTLKGNGDADGWTIKYYDGDEATPAKDITTQMTSSSGWTLPAALEPGDSRVILVSAKPATGASNSRDAIVTVVDGTDVVDCAKAITAFQSIGSIQYSLNSGATWIAVSDNNLPAIEQYSVVGFRAVRRNNSIEWPGIKPQWTVNGAAEGQEAFVAEDVYLYFPDVSPEGSDGFEIKAECGSTISTKIRVVSSTSMAQIFVYSEKTNISSGGSGEKAQTEIVALVTDGYGAPMSGKSVQFSSLYNDGTAAGTLKVNGILGNTSATDESGYARIALVSGSRISAANVTGSILNESNQVVMTSDAQIIQFVTPQ